MGVAAIVLAAVVCAVKSQLYEIVSISDGRHCHVTSNPRCKCRKCGFLAFVCIPGLMQAEQAMHAAGELMPRDVEDDTPSLLKKVSLGAGRAACKPSPVKSWEAP